MQYFKNNWPRPGKRYNLEYLIKVVQDFHEKNGRTPTYMDVETLSKKRQFPSSSVFTDKGGLSWVIERAGLQPTNKVFSPLIVSGDLKAEFRKFVRKFRADNCGYFPTPEQCKKEFSISYSSFRTTTGNSYQEALINLGANVRKSRIANLPLEDYK